MRRSATPSRMRRCRASSPRSRRMTSRGRPRLATRHAGSRLPPPDPSRHRLPSACARTSPSTVPRPQTSAPHNEGGAGMCRRWSAWGAARQGRCPGRSAGERATGTRPGRRSHDCIRRRARSRGGSRSGDAAPVDSTQSRGDQFDRVPSCEPWCARPMRREQCVRRPGRASGTDPRGRDRLLPLSGARPRRRRAPAPDPAGPLPRHRHLLDSRVVARLTRPTGADVTDDGLEVRAPHRTARGRRPSE